MRQETTLVYPKQESASPLTRRITVVPATPASVLAQEVYMMIPTRAEMRQRTRQIMEIKQAHQSHGVHPGTVTGDTVNFPNFKPRSHHEVENVVS